MIDRKQEIQQEERAIIVGVVTKSQTELQVQEYLDELAFLAETAGAVTIKRFVQKLAHPDSKTFVGKGKLQEIKKYVEEKDISLIIFDDELTGSQIMNIEKELGMQQTFSFTKEKINATRDKKVLKAHLAVSNTLYSAVQPLPYSLKRIVYGLYMKQNYAGKLKWLFSAVAKVHKKEIDLGDVSGQLRIFEGKAELLRNEELYQPYLKEYLL